MTARGFAVAAVHVAQLRAGGGQRVRLEVGLNAGR